MGRGTKHTTTWKQCFDMGNIIILGILNYSDICSCDDDTISYFMRPSSKFQIWPCHIQLSVGSPWLCVTDEDRCHLPRCPVFAGMQPPHWPEHALVYTECVVRLKTVLLGNHVQQGSQYTTMSVREGIRKKIRNYLGIFPNIGGGLLNPKTFVIWPSNFWHAQIILRC